MDKKRIKIGNLSTGKLNNICDVNGVMVGHKTIRRGNNNTGLTVVMPHQENIFKSKVQAASFVMNGYGKTIGLIQVDEMGTIETPIILTNTLNVGKVCDGLISYMLENNPEIGVSTGTINPIICECNDSHLNDIRNRVLSEKDVIEAIENVSSDFGQGSVGAGTGMICHGLKGGIGSSSRLFTIDNKEYTLGVLVNSNFGQDDSSELIINGKYIGREISKIRKDKTNENKGSIIVIIASDLEVDNRQLKRIAKRAVVGIGKTGSLIGNGSGDIIISFTTANQVNHFERDTFSKVTYINDEHLNMVFKATIEATEEAIINSLINSETMIGKDNRKCLSINEFASLFEDIYE